MVINPHFNQTFLLLVSTENTMKQLLFSTLILLSICTGIKKITSISTQYQFHSLQWILGFAIKCYNGDGPEKRPEIECPEDIDQCFKVYSSGKYLFCCENMIFCGLKSFDFSVTKIHTYSCDNKNGTMENGCTEKGQMIYCYCNTDLCNGQVKTVSSLVLITLSLFPVIFKMIWISHQNMFSSNSIYANEITFLTLINIGGVSVCFVNSY